MAIDLDDLLDAGCLEEGGGHAFFYTEDYTIGSGYLERDEKRLLGCERGLTPMAVEPSLMASREYSTWKRRPSGEKVLKKVSF
jgi:hypothetical protein